jgi:hypothetical protein
MDDFKQSEEVSFADSSSLYITCPRCHLEHIATHIVCPETGKPIVAADHSHGMKLVYIWLLRTSLAFLGVLIGYLSLNWAAFVFLAAMFALLFSFVLRHFKDTQFEFLAIYGLSITCVVAYDRNVFDVGSKFSQYIPVFVFFVSLTLLARTFAFLQNRTFNLAVTSVQFIAFFACIILSILVRGGNMDGLALPLVWLGGLFGGGVLISCLTHALFSGSYHPTSNIIRAATFNYPEYNKPSRINPPRIEGSGLDIVFAKVFATIVITFINASNMIVFSIKKAFIGMVVTLKSIVFELVNAIVKVLNLIAQLITNIFLRLVEIVSNTVNSLLSYLKTFILPLVVGIIISNLMLNFDFLLFGYIHSPASSIVESYLQLAQMTLIILGSLTLGILTVCILLPGKFELYLLSFGLDLREYLFPNFLVIFFFTDLAAILSNLLLEIFFQKAPVFTIGPLFWTLVFCGIVSLKVYLPRFNLRAAPEVKVTGFAEEVENNP